MWKLFFIPAAFTNCCSIFNFAYSVRTFHSVICLFYPSTNVCTYVVHVNWDFNSHKPAFFVNTNTLLGYGIRILRQNCKIETIVDYSYNMFKFEYIICDCWVGAICILNVCRLCCRSIERHWFCIEQNIFAVYIQVYTYKGAHNMLCTYAYII